jgi:uncharacterized membrane protein YeaQ/YmgE (transglycosylase-associated protein family)
VNVERELAGVDERSIPAAIGRGLEMTGACMMNIVWLIAIGFLAGVVARLLAPGPNKPTGFVLTTVLGIAGAFFATWIGQLLGWYRPDQGAGLIAATIGAVAVLFLWNRLVASRVIGDPGVRT